MSHLRWSALAVTFVLFSAKAFAQQAEVPPPTADGASEPSSEVRLPQAQQVAVAQNILSTAPTNLLVGTYSIEYERAVAAALSVFLSPAYVTFSANLGQNLTTGLLEQGSTVGYRLNGGARYYFSREAPTGFFVGVQLQYDNDVRSFTFVRGSDSALVGASSYHVVSWGVGIMAGYNVLLGNLFAISVGFGGGFQYSLVQQTSGSGASTTEAGPAPGVDSFLLPRLNFGFAF